MKVFICPKVGDGSNENPYRPSVQDFVDSLNVGVIETKDTGDIFVCIARDISAAHLTQISRQPDTFVLDSVDRRKPVATNLRNFLLSRGRYKGEANQVKLIRSLVKEAEPRYPVDRDFPE